MYLTLFTEVGGATHIDQFEVASLRQAVEYWSEHSSSRPHFADLSLAEDDLPVAVDGITNVWCFTRIDDNDSVFLVHVVRTENDES